jgi:hypothetical protein
MTFVGAEHDEPGQVPDLIHVPETRSHFFDASGNRVKDVHG